MFSITKINGQTNSSQTKEYTCDLLSDIENLPHKNTKGTQLNELDTISNECCAIGSTAFVIEDSSEWILGNDDIWHLKTNSNDSIKLDITNYLAKDNTEEYIPADNYNPATKKYVDDIVGNINTILASIVGEVE